jgi:ATP-dependent helicase HrpA
MRHSARVRDQEAQRLVARRAAPPLRFKHDPELPITARRTEILAALDRERVVIVAGETGSGKSTQLPQYALELGRGIEGMIAHTQPRRLAARALASRIADELGQTVGETVGFRVRFADKVGDATRLALLTDGLLLAELNADPLLRRYDTVIVDEAHERTLNVDLLLGVLRRLLSRRSDLKVIVTSATLDVARMARFFADAPVITVSGRSHPIEVRYRPSDAGPEEADLPTAVLQAYREIETEPGDVGAGDVLVFLPGEREISDVGELLEREVGDAEVVPLYSRLAWEQQAKIFSRAARRRIVLATNIAETSITVPGIRAVIDSGLARVSRYSVRSRLQRLPIEAVSRASAEQRKGRCGRLGSGLCLRLYAEEDFAGRAEFTEPEILRTNLAALLLRLAADGLGAAEDFPFIDPPEARARGDGYRLLQELGALDEARHITRRGRAMARLPLDPRLARALLESQRFRAEGEVLAIVSGLSVPEVRIAASGPKGDEADEAAAYDDSKSEFTGLVKLWRAYRGARERPRRELRRWCKERHLSLLRLSEWDNVYSQVRERAADVGIVPGGRPASYTAVHRSLLAGFSTMVGVRGEEGIYHGTRGVRFSLFPGSPLKRRKPTWVMAASIVETSRVYARRLAEVQPVWIESAAERLLKREYLEPDWSEAREEVVARERTSFLGLILSADRIVNYGPIAPEESRHIFAREALVYQRLLRRPDWLVANDAAIEAGRRVEERLRSRDLLVDAEALVGFYDRVLPRQVSSAVTLDHYTRHLDARQLQALTLTDELLYARRPDEALLLQFPEQVRLPLTATPPPTAANATPAAAGEVQAEVHYRFAPGDLADGATLHIPLLALPLIERAAVDAAVPGLARPRIDALLRSLPKDARRQLIPIAESVTRFLASGLPADRDGLTDWLRDAESLPPALRRLEPSAIDAHLTPQLCVMDDGKALVRGRDLAALRRGTASLARLRLEELARARHPESLQRFDWERLPETLSVPLAGGELTLFPAIRANAAGAQVTMHWTHAEAQRELRLGATQLARRTLERESRDLARALHADARLLLAASPYARGDALIESLISLAVLRACFGNADPPRSRNEFAAALERVRPVLHGEVLALGAQALEWYSAGRAVRRLLEDPRARAYPAEAAASLAHIESLLDPKAWCDKAAGYLSHLPRYLRAEERRWQRLLSRGGEPAAIAGELSNWGARLLGLQQALADEQRWLPELADLASLIEEYRVSLYAQELKTAQPVSAARLEQRALAIETWLRR